MPATPRIPAYLRLSRHGIYYFRIVVPSALRPRWRGCVEIKKSLKTHDVREALRKARDLAIETYRRFEYARRDMSVIPVDPNDPSTWPTDASDIRRFEKTVTLAPEGHIASVAYKVDPNSPADIAAAAADERKFHLRQRIMRDPNSPEAQAFFEAEDAEIRRELEHADKLRALALAAEEEKLRGIAAAPRPVTSSMQGQDEGARPLPQPAASEISGHVSAGPGGSSSGHGLRPASDEANGRRSAVAQATWTNTCSHGYGRDFWRPRPRKESTVSPKGLTR